MAFFKFRKGGDDPSAAAGQPETIEVMRQRAKHRLLGAVILVLAGVVGFPLLFDTQPRPIAVDLPIEIPDKTKVKPLVIPSPAPQVVVSAPVVAAAPAASGATAAPTQAVVAEVVAPALPPATLPAPPKPAVVAPLVEARAAKANVVPPPAAVHPPPAPDDGAKALALLEGKAPQEPKVASGARFVVQIGAYADPVKAREVRQKLERSGLKTYTHVAQTKDGARTRVRVGPFADKTQAQQAVARITQLELPAVILNLD